MFNQRKSFTATELFISQMISLFLFFVFCLMSFPVEAITFKWSGKCGSNVQWSRTCNGSENNWDQEGQFPDENDSIELTESDPDTSVSGYFIVKNVSAQSKVTLDGAFKLTVLQGGVFRDISLTGGVLISTAGNTISLGGTSILGGELSGDGVGGGFLLSNQWSGGFRAKNGAHVRSSGEGLISARTVIDGPAEFENLANLTQQATVEGALGEFVNKGGFTVSGGVNVEFQPEWTDEGTIRLKDAGTKLWVKSRVTIFDSTEFSVDEGTELLIQALNGAGQDHTIRGTTTILGNGLLEFKDKDFDVEGILGNFAGTGTPETGEGGLKLSFMTMELAAGAKITNQPGARLQLNSGTIAGGSFENLGETFTMGFGHGVLSTHVVNRKNFSILCCSVSLSDSNQFLNYKNVIVNGQLLLDPNSQFVNKGVGIVEFADGFRSAITRLAADGARIQGDGLFRNNGELVVDVGESNLAIISSRFNNWGTWWSGPTGSVRVKTGSLRFQGDGLTNLSTDNDLSGGYWFSDGTALLDFPIPIKTVGKSVRTSINLDAPNPDFESLDEIFHLSEVTINGGQNFNGPIIVKGKLSGEGLTINGKATMLDDGRLVLAPGDPVNVPGGVDIGKDDGGELPGLESEDESGGGNGGGKSDAGTASGVLSVTKLITPLVNNYGRVSPGGRSGLGQIDIEGDYFQHAGGRLHIDVISAGQSDVLNVDGDATLSGVFEVGRYAAGDPDVGVWHTILTTTGSLSGVFDEVRALDDVELRYNTQSIELRFISVEPGMLFIDSFE